MCKAVVLETTTFPLQNTAPSNREHGNSLDAYGNTPGQAETESEGKLSRMEYPVL